MPSRAVLLASTLLAAGALATQASAAPLEQGALALTLEAGTDFSLDGDVHGGATAPVASLAALNPNLPGVPAELRIGARSFDRIYGETLSFGLEGAYGLGSNREAFFTLRYATADEGRTEVGSAFVPALNASVPVNGSFSDYKATSVEAGLRQFFGEGDFRPYVAARAGVAFVDDIKASFTVPVPAGVGAEPNDIVLSNVPFYDSSTSWRAGVDAGIAYAVSEKVSLMGEVGLTYQGDLDGDDTAIGGLGLASINNKSDQLTGSFRVRARFAF